MTCACGQRSWVALCLIDAQQKPTHFSYPTKIIPKPPLYLYSRETNAPYMRTYIYIFNCAFFVLKHYYYRVAMGGAALRHLYLGSTA